MKLNYTMKSNGIYIISSRDFGDIAINALRENRATQENVFFSRARARARVCV